ncbi:hypothetical protein K1719_021482 [Acacia pycnantha]|nr:hypothetical protein K1719_021482 [Acacia pycnantha]
MAEVSLNSEPVIDDDADGFEIEGDCEMADFVSQTGIIQGENPLPPAVGMEFETYEDVYYFYNCYARDQGFGVRVSNTWYRKSKERYRGKFSCSSAGFKKRSEANRPRPETRTGCPAMVKFRLTDSKRWRIIEVELEHNHLISPTSGKFYKSHKRLGLGTKRALQFDSTEEIRKIRLFRTVIVDGETNGSVEVDEGQPKSKAVWSDQLKLNKEKLGGLLEYEAVKAAISRAVYYSLRTEEFDAAWEDMMQQYEIRGHEWLQALYGDRKRWVPVYVKETLLAGMFPIQPSDKAPWFFEGYLSKQTPLKEFLVKYDQALQTKWQHEALADLDSRNSTFMHKPSCYFELQISKLYTNELFRMFEREIKGMYSCLSSRQINVDEPVISYLIKEQVEVEGNHQRVTRDYEVYYNGSETEVLCICGLFNFKGILCRHALSVLNQNGIEEIPPQYILSRWRKDVKRSYVIDHKSSGIDIDNPIHRYDHLYRRIVQVVEEGGKSHGRFRTAMQEFSVILDKLKRVNLEDHAI